MRVRWMAVAVVAGMVPVGGQVLHADGPLPSFEVASVRPWKAAPLPMPTATSSGLPVKVSPMGVSGQKTDRVHFIGQAAILIASAYNVPMGSEGRMIVGGPAWIQSQDDRYEVQAKIEGSAFAAMQGMTAAQQREQVSLMEQSLLAERFGLKVHFETRETPGYALVVAKGGAKLTAAKEGEVSRLSEGEKGQAQEMTGVAVTMEQMVRSPLMVVDGHRVVDQTGLTGSYDFVLEFSRGDGEGGAPGLFTAIEEQMGLRLVAVKQRVEVVVVDHIERPGEQ